MGPESILLEVTRGGREGTYRFTCPTCMDAVEKRADRKIVALLVSAGVDVAGRGMAVDTEEITESLFEPEPAPEDPRGPLPAGPAFTMDDVIDFHFALQDDGAVRQFLGNL